MILTPTKESNFLQNCQEIRLTCSARNPGKNRNFKKWGHRTKRYHVDAICMVCGSTSHCTFELLYLPTLNKVVKSRAWKMIANINYINFIGTCIDFLRETFRFLPNFDHLRRRRWPNTHLPPKNLCSF